MSKINELLQLFIQVINEPWSSRLAGQEKVWFLVFDPTDLRKLEFKLSEFEIQTKKAGKDWREVSLEKQFTQWIAGHDYKEAYFENPDDIIDPLQGEFEDRIIEFAKESIAHNTESELIVLKDVSALFGFVKLSTVIDAIAKDVKGRLMILFPGEHSNNEYRLLDARAGWDYHARPIKL